MSQILHYIQGLDKNTLTSLYSQPATCLAVLRLLQPLSKHIVMRLLFVDAVDMAVVSAWIFDQRQTSLVEALDSLSQFNIANDNQGFLTINHVFQDSLKNALVGGGNTSSFGLPTDSKDKKDITTEYLDAYAKESWEAVLHFLVGTPINKKTSAVMALMEDSGLMSREGQRNSAELRITNKGFQFLLQDVNEQVWGILLQYLEMAPTKMGMNPVDVLNFLFQLGSLEFGQDYSIDVLTDTQKQMLDDLKHFGLVYQRKKKSSRFYPTRLATSLTSGAAASGDTGDAGYIIVET
ncbi:RNA polymerase II transcription factor B 52 kDa subunit, partial [Podochytrium sp. JEL0797]